MRVIEQAKICKVEIRICKKYAKNLHMLEKSSTFVPDFFAHACSVRTCEQG